MLTKKETLKISLLVACLGAGASRAGVTTGKTVDEVLAAYVAAVGGKAAIDRIQTREIHAREHRGPRLTYFWQEPDKVVLLDGRQKTGYDGGSGWVLSKKKKVSKLPKGAQIRLEMDANPLRYANLKQLYPDVHSAPAEKGEDGGMMDILSAENDLGATKFYFDHSTHLLARVEESGETSAYFKHVTEFSDYKEADGVKLPFRIVHRSNEPDSKAKEISVSEVLHNVPLKPGLFSKPAPGALVLGGKR